MNETDNKTRYVIQKHTKPDDTHWDLMIELRGILVTWRVNIGPEQMQTSTCSVTKIHDHDLKFLTYNGPVNKGTGNVTIADSGIFCVQQWDKNCIKGRLEGSSIKAKLHLCRIKRDKWQLKCHG